jgi:hypothetical protein
VQGRDNVQRKRELLTRGPGLSAAEVEVAGTLLGKSDAGPGLLWRLGRFGSPRPFSYFLYFLFLFLISICFI